MIETSEGLKAVESFVGGEFVWSRNDKTLEYGYRPVVDTKRTENQPIFKVVIANQQGQQETLETTVEHPFWVKDYGWLKASVLESGMTLLDRHNNELKVVSQHLIPDYLDTVYNIEIEGFHTYHVGELGTWVHNADCFDLSLAKYDPSPLGASEAKKPYNPLTMQEDFKAVYGEKNVKSTTVPTKPSQASSSKSNAIVDSNGGKAVQIQLNDGSTKMIPYDSRGLAIFDDVVVFTTKIDQSKSYRSQMSQASRDTWNVIKDDLVAQSKFTPQQLNDLKLGKQVIDGYTWHHNAQSAPNSMQLVPDYIHSRKGVPHTGQNALKNGR